MENITKKDIELAAQCGKCPVCNHARKKQRGIAYFFVKKNEHGICPACQAYEKVNGKKAYEPV